MKSQFNEREVINMLKESDGYFCISIDKSGRLIINSSVSDGVNEDSDAVYLTYLAMEESERFRRIVFSAIENHYKNSIAIGDLEDDL
jgi:hypothetical protein